MSDTELRRPSGPLSATLGLASITTTMGLADLPGSMRNIAASLDGAMQIFTVRGTKLFQWYAILGASLSRARPRHRASVLQ